MLKRVGQSDDVPGWLLIPEGDARVSAACNSQTWRGVIQSPRNAITLLTRPISFSLSLSLSLAFTEYLSLFSVARSLTSCRNSTIPGGRVTRNRLDEYADSYVALITDWKKSSGVTIFSFPNKHGTSIIVLSIIWDATKARFKKNNLMLKSSTIVHTFYKI